MTKAEKIDNLVGTYAEYGKFNGSVLVAKEGEIIYKNGFGSANMEWDIPNQTNTKFRLASVTKQFTAILIMQLVADDKLDLAVPILTYLPEYPEENGTKINIHHLLTHTSGIPNYTSFPNYRDIMSDPILPGEIVKLFVDSTLQFTPGEKFSYSNSGYVLLGSIIEKITGKSFEEVLQEKILTPLSMNNTGFDHNRKILGNRAAGYYNNVGNYVNANFIDMSIGYTAGGMYSTVEDMYIWDKALYTGKLLPKKYLDQIFNKHIPAWGQHYGYGWNVGEMQIGNTEDLLQTFDHDGVINGFSSLILRIPSDHASIILLNNTGGAPLYNIGRAISGILYDKTYDLPKESLATSLVKIIKKDGLEKGLSFYQEFKNAGNYVLLDHEMNMAGYNFLQSGNPEAGLALLRLNIEAHPNSFNAYDSYGEALMMQGENTEAIKNYKKSLELNPKNENGIEMLIKLGVEIDRESLFLLKTDETWTSEIFTFPLNFAPNLQFEGIEEAHFPKGWRNINSPEFWSYAFAWNINLTRRLSENELENYLQIYFDGLTKVVNKEKDLVLPDAASKMYKMEKVGDVSRFSGTIKIHDAFVTKKIMTLNVLVENHYCEQKKKSIILFKFSPKEFGNEIWRVLEKVHLSGKVCEN
jgi:CubicO group peptidase (beta-lactamase class C family)